MLRKALLVGINEYTDSPLRGCINDVMDMRDILTGLYGYKSDGIKILLNGEATKQAIINGLRWLAEGGDATVTRVFHYAGYGDFQLKTEGDEKDSVVEALAPHDYPTNGLLIDDKLTELYKTFSTNSNLTLIKDSCFSGTVQRDLEGDIVYRSLPASMEKRKAVHSARAKSERSFLKRELADLRDKQVSDEVFKEWLERALDNYKKQILFGGDYDVRQGNVLLAACQSDQRAADVKIENKYHGAFTYHLVKVLRIHNGQISHQALIQETSQQLKRFVQIPQLQCDKGKEQLDLFSVF